MTSGPWPRQPGQHPRPGHVFRGPGLPPHPDPCDLLVLESTYGDRNHENRADRQAALAKALDHALSDKGIVYIPAFALGRTQELIYELDRINPGVPVFIDSPLGIEITRLYQDMDGCWDKEAKTLKAASNHPIKFEHLYAVERFKDHCRLLDLKGPAVIIAGSGMCTGGRIVHHLKHGLTGYSAHADQQTLAAWVAAMPEPTPVSQMPQHPIPTQDLIWDEAIYPRSAVNRKTVEAYVEALSIGAQFPAVKVQQQDRILDYEAAKTELLLTTNSGMAVVFLCQ